MKGQRCMATVRHPPQSPSLSPPSLRLFRRSTAFSSPRSPLLSRHRYRPANGHGNARKRAFRAFWGFGRVFYRIASKNRPYRLLCPSCGLFLCRSLGGGLPSGASRGPFPSGTSAAFLMRSTSPFSLLRSRHRERIRPFRALFRLILSVSCATSRTRSWPRS